jgi:hypothetical protein
VKQRNALLVANLSNHGYGATTGTEGTAAYQPQDNAGRLPMEDCMLSVGMRATSLSAYKGCCSHRLLPAAVC